jgi:hypothetical protein
MRSAPVLRDRLLARFWHRGPRRDAIGADVIVVERLVADQAAEAQTVDQRVDADAVVTLAGQQMEADEIAERIGERQDLGGPAAPGGADGLASGPDLAPWPCR